MLAWQLAIGTRGRIKLSTNVDEAESAMDADQSNYGRAIDVSFCAA